MNDWHKVFTKRRNKVWVCLVVAVFVIWVAGFLAAQPTFQVITEIRMEDGMVVQHIRRVEMNLLYRLLPPQRYLKVMQVMGVASGTEPAYPGKKLDWTYPVFHHPNPEKDQTLNSLVEELLHHPRGVGKGIEYTALIAWQKAEDQSLELTYRRSYYPFFAVRPLEDSGNIVIEK